MPVLLRVLKQIVICAFAQERRYQKIRYKRKSLQYGHIDDLIEVAKDKINGEIVLHSLNLQPPMAFISARCAQRLVGIERVILKTNNN